MVTPPPALSREIRAPIGLPDDSGRGGSFRVEKGGVPDDRQGADFLQGKRGPPTVPEIDRKKGGLPAPIFAPVVWKPVEAP